MKKLNLVLSAVGLALGLSVIQAEADVNVNWSGTMDFHVPYLLSGGEEEDAWRGNHSPSDVDGSLLGYHAFHPKLTIDIGEHVAGEALICFSDDHTPRLWVGQVDYTPFVPEGFGDNPITLRAGFFMVPFAQHAYTYVSLVDMKTITRPLASPDHYKAGQQIEGGPDPILQMPTSDKGLMLFGTKWLGGRDQLWYGVYVIDGPSRTDGHPTSHEATDRNRAKHVGGKISYSLDTLLTVGLSAMVGNWDPAEGKEGKGGLTSFYPDGGKLAYDLYGIDLHLALPRGANLRGEYLLNPIEWDPETDGTKKGWYAQFDFPLNAIFTGSDTAKKFELAFMYSQLEGTREEAAGEPYAFNSISRSSAALSFMPNPAVKYKIEYAYTPLGTPNDTENFQKLDDIAQLNLAVGLTF